MKTILVLEDDAWVLNVIWQIIAHSGYNVLMALSANQAFQRFEENGHLDLLVTDVVLPASSGICVALKLRVLLPDLKIIFMSGYPTSTWHKHDIAEVSKLPSHSVVTLEKPFLPETLLEHIHKLIGPAVGPLAPKLASHPASL